MMLVSRRALPLCVLLLCAAGEVPRGVCVDEKCCAFFMELSDSTEAESRCQDTGGTLYDVGLWGLTALPLPHGHFWIKATQNTGTASEARCGSVFVTSEGVRFENRTCTDRLDGIMCQYTSTCRVLLPSDAHVNYITEWGFEGQTVFPPGTVAVVRVPDHPPISKHICAGTQWMRAPWSCEVMSGGCEHECTGHTCSCPAGQVLHHNNFTCTDHPCAICAHLCVNVTGNWECRCREGFKLGSGGLCVDVDECSVDRTLCSGPGEACENKEGSYECTCQEDYDLLNGVCVDTAICFECEQDCVEGQGEFRCACYKGFRVDPQDPTKCEEFCSEQDCPAKCPSPGQCYCPPGYIQDQRDKGTVCTDIDECEVEEQCDHHCNNTFGGFFCVCEEGFELEDGHHCVLLEPLQVLGQSRPTAATVHPTAIPSYVKAGSILGITVFALLCAALLYFLLYKLFTYCTKVQFYSLKRDMEIFTLQQVSTETYKRLSHDWQFRNDCHRL